MSKIVGIFGLIALIFGVFTGCKPRNETASQLTTVEIEDGSGLPTTFNKGFLIVYDQADKDIVADKPLVMSAGKRTFDLKLKANLTYYFHMALHETGKEDEGFSSGYCEGAREVTITRTGETAKKYGFEVVRVTEGSDDKAKVKLNICNNIEGLGEEQDAIVQTAQQTDLYITQVKYIYNDVAVDDDAIENQCPTGFRLPWLGELKAFHRKAVEATPKHLNASQRTGVKTYADSQAKNLFYKKDGAVECVVGGVETSVCGTPETRHVLCVSN